METITKIITFLQSYDPWVRYFLIIWALVLSGVLIWAPRKKQAVEDQPPSISLQQSSGSNSPNVIGNGNIVNVSSAVQPPRFKIRIEPNQGTSTAKFTDTKFVITNDSDAAIYNVRYVAEFWDGDMPDDVETRMKFAFFCVSEEARLDPSVSMSARVELGQVLDPRTKVLVDPLKIQRPVCNFLIWYRTSPNDSEIQAGRMFWAEKNSEGKYIWNSAGGFREFKATDPWPHLDRR